MNDLSFLFFSFLFFFFFALQILWILAIKRNLLVPLSYNFLIYIMSNLLDAYFRPSIVLLQDC
jgi:hypothetical protein